MVEVMDRVVTEYQGTKYSLQPHGPKSKLMIAFSLFVVAFGGALLAASPAQATNGEVFCSVETTPPTPQAPMISPTPCPSPVTITVTVSGPTVFVTKTVTKTSYITKEVMVTPTEDISVPSSSPVSSSTPQPSYTPLPLDTSPTSTPGKSSLMGWGIAMAAIGGTVLVILGVAGMTRRRRYSGAHHVDTPTQIMPDEHSVSDYNPNAGGYDPALGGHAGETYQAGTDTQEMPPAK
jgi:hypothetical protein